MNWIKKLFKKNRPYILDVISEDNILEILYSNRTEYYALLEDGWYKMPLKVKCDNSTEYQLNYINNNLTYFKKIV